MTKSKKLIITIITVCLMLFSSLAIIGFTTTATAYASDNKETGNNYITTYYGSITIDDNYNYIVTTNSFHLNLPNYLYYQLTDDNEQSIYLADVTSVPNYESYNIFEVKIIPSINNYLFRNQSYEQTLYLRQHHSIEVVYMDVNDNLHVIYAPLTSTMFETFTEKSQQYDMIEGEYLYNILNDSLHFEEEYRVYLSQHNSEQINFNIQTYSTLPDNGYANSNKTVRMNQFDVYTNSDALLKDYYLLHQNAQHKAYYPSTGYLVFSDNPIVNILPKQLLRQLGQYSYVGTEYGFYIHTYDSYTSTTEQYIFSRFYIFDIEHIKKSQYQNGMLSIKPYMYGKTTYNANNDIVSVDEVSLSSFNKYALANIRCIIDVSNIDQPNPGDANYNYTTDYGYAINSYSVTAKGVGKSSNSSDPKVDLIKAGIGTLVQLPFNNSMAKKVACTVTTSLINNLEQKFYTPGTVSQYVNLRKSNDTYFYDNFTIPNCTDFRTMDKYYGEIIKGIDCSLISKKDSNGNDIIDKSQPLLYKTNDHEFKVEYGLMHNGTIYFENYITSQISLDIVQDNTKKTLWWESGSLDYLDYVGGGFVQTFVDVNDEEKVTNLTQDEFYMAEFEKDSYKLFSFTPQKSDNYVFETIGDGDSIIIIPSLNVSNDDGGTYKMENGLRRCSKLKVYLEANRTYEIQIKTYSPSSAGNGYFNVIVKRSDTILETKRNPNEKTMVIMNYDSMWYEFIPEYSDFYTFTTYQYENNSCDTYLSLYNHNHEQLAFDDDSSPDGYYSCLSLYLTKGETYYVRVRTYSNSYGICGLNITKMEITGFSYGINIMGYYKDIELEPATTCYFRFTAPESNSFTFETQYKNGYKDLYMIILDKNFNIVSTADDEGGNMQPKATITINKNETYYFLIRQYSENATERTEFAFTYKIT